MDRRIFLVACAALAAGPAFAAEDWPTEPQAIVGKLYGVYKKDSKSAYDDKQVHARYFSASLDTLIKKAEAKSRRINEPIIDFDPIINGQDWEAPKGLVVTVETPGADKQVLLAKYSMFGSETFVRYDFVQENGAWRIFDLRGGVGKDAWSLRKIAAQ